MQRDIPEWDETTVNVRKIMFVSRFGCLLLIWFEKEGPQCQLSCVCFKYPWKSIKKNFKSLNLQGEISVSQTSKLLNNSWASHDTQCSDRFPSLVCLQTWLPVLYLKRKSLHNVSVTSTLSVLNWSWQFYCVSNWVLFDGAFFFLWSTLTKQLLTKY